MKIDGTMQHSGLTITSLIRHAYQTYGDREIIHRRFGARETTTVASTLSRAMHMAMGLQAMGIQPGQPVATFMSSEIEHLEAYWGIPAAGMVLHALNIRMHGSELAELLEASQDKVVLVGAEHLERFIAVSEFLRGSSFKTVIVTGQDVPDSIPGWDVDVVSYEALAAGEGSVDLDALPEVSETAAAALCHTGGTTGLPKSVVYSHRAIWLSANGLCHANAIGFSRSDTVLLAVPLFHASGWVIPFSVMMSGSNLVLPGATTQSADLQDFIEQSGVTVAVGIPTIWMDLLKHQAASGRSDMPHLNRIATGGAVVPEALIHALAERGVNVLQAWGMTEATAIAVVGDVARDIGEFGTGEARPIGYLMPHVEARIAPLDNTEEEGDQTGEMQLRGASVISHYMGVSPETSHDDGWLRTGDVCAQDAQGRYYLTDRLKDAIKSGGNGSPLRCLRTHCAPCQM